MGSQEAERQNMPDSKTGHAELDIATEQMNAEHRKRQEQHSLKFD
jgi:hypothetical protein